MTSEKRNAPRLDSGGVSFDPVKEGRHEAICPMHRRHAPVLIQRGPRPSDHFTIIATAALQDVRLSFVARGLLAFLLSHEPGESIASERLAERVKESRDTIRGALAELETLGYLMRSKTRQAGRFLWTATITDAPTIDGRPVDGLNWANAVDDRGSPSTDVPSITTKETDMHRFSEVGAQVADEVRAALAASFRVPRG